MPIEKTGKSSLPLLPEPDRGPWLMTDGAGPGIQPVVRVQFQDGQGLVDAGMVSLEHAHQAEATKRLTIVRFEKAADGGDEGVTHQDGIHGQLTGPPAAPGMSAGPDWGPAHWAPLRRGFHPGQAHEQDS